MAEKAIKNNQLLKQISAELLEIKGDVTKLNMIEEKIKKGEYDAKYNNGWFWWDRV